MFPPAGFRGTSLPRAVQSGGWVPITTGAGVNLWLGNNALADGVNPFVHGALEPVAREVSARARDSMDADGRFARLALEAIRAQPVRVLRLSARREAARRFAPEVDPLPRSPSRSKGD